jgi:hypothetical protein
MTSFEDDGRQLMVDVMVVDVMMVDAMMVDSRCG